MGQKIYTLPDVPDEVLTHIVQDATAAVSLSLTCKEYHEKLGRHIRDTRETSRQWRDRHVYSVLQQYTKHNDHGEAELSSQHLDSCDSQTWSKLLLGILMYASANRTDGRVFAQRAFSLFNTCFAAFLQDYEFYFFLFGEQDSTELAWSDKLPDPEDTVGWCYDERPYEFCGYEAVDTYIPVQYMVCDFCWLDTIYRGNEFKQARRHCLDTFLSMLKEQPTCVQRLIIQLQG